MNIPKIKDKNGKVIEPREWQKAAFKKVAEKMADPEAVNSALLNVCPGGGKTKLGVMTAKHALGQGLVDKVVIVSPRKKIVGQWSDDMTVNAVLTKADLTSKKAQDRKDGLPTPGLSITYQILSSEMVCQYIAGVCNRFRTLVIMDEIHWGGELDGTGNQWGERLIKATERARFCLALSGTPFRTDHYRIPFLTYKDGVGRADYDYTYGQALQHGVVTPIYFREMEGVINYTKTCDASGEVIEEESMDFADGVYHTPTGEVDDAKMNKRLTAALHPTSGYWRAIMDQAIQRLEWIRANRQSNAGGIVFAVDQKHAASIAAFIAQQTGEQPAVIISNESSDIDGFASSNKPWVVSVKMISEGVDIERLRVAAFLTNVTTRKNFMQSVARTIRLDYESNGPDAWSQEAYVHMPADPRFREYAQEFADAVADVEKDVPEKGDADPTDYEFVPSSFDVEASEIDEGGVIFGDEYWSAEEIRQQTAEIESRVDRDVLDKLGAVMSEEMRHTFAEQLMRDQRKGA